MPTLREFVHLLSSETRDQLYSDLLLLDLNNLQELPSLDLDRLRDNPNYPDPGWSFLLDSRNKDQFTSINASTWLYNRILSHPIIGSQFTRSEALNDSDSEENLWNPTKLTEYFNLIRQFKDKLLTLVHLTSGAPARGTELISIRFQNTENGGLRSVFIENGLLALVPTYHKGINTTGKPKVIHRYLPKEVSLLVIYYLWLVIPFEYNIRILFETTPEKTGPTAFLWPEKPRRIDNQASSPLRKRPRRGTTATTALDIDIDVEESISNLEIPFWHRYSY